MSSGHTHRGMGLGAHVLQKLMSNPEIRDKLFQSRQINKDYDIPYLAGYSNDGSTIYFDRHLPDKISFEIDGRNYEYNPESFICQHEMFEKAVIDVLGWAYPAAHEAATGYERRAVVAAGLPWQGYQNSLKPFIKTDEKESIQKVPADLDMKPYLTPPVDYKMVAHLQKHMEGGSSKHSKEEVGYTDGHPTAHCGPVTKWPKGDCVHYEGDHVCSLVRGYIRPTGWCGLYEPKETLK